MPEPTLDDLRWMLRTQAEDVLVPVPPLDEVAGDLDTRRRRRRRNGVLGGLVAAIVAGLVVVAGLHADGGTSPDPAETPTPTATPTGRFRTLEDLEKGPPTDLAYATGSKLILGARTITFPQRIGELVQAGDTIVVALDRARKVIRIDRDTGASEVLAARTGGRLAIAPDGSAVAWLKDGEGATVVLHWLKGAEGENEKAFPAEPSCCDNPFVINGITADGQLIASLPGFYRSWVWDYGSLLLGSSGHEDRVRRIRADGDAYIADVYSRGIVVQTPGSAGGPLRAGPVDGDVFRPTTEFDGERAFLDDYGRVLIDKGGRAVVRAYAMGEDEEHTLALPPGTVVEDMAQETPDTVLLDVQWSDGSAYELAALVRCDLEELTCEKVANTPVDVGVLF